MNEEFKTRIRYPMSDREMKRRWETVQSAMQAQGIELLIAQNADQYLGGYFRYFTDLPTEQSYPMSVLFPVKGEMTTITSASASNPLPPPWAARGIETRLGAPYFRTFNYTDLYDAQLMVTYIKERQCRVVGWVAPSLLNSKLVNHVTAQCPEVEFVDATDMVDEIKAVKSDDEIRAIRRVVKLHDDGILLLKEIIKPGLYEYEIRAEVNKFLINRGSEENLCMCGSAQSGMRTPKLHSFYQNRRIADGDDLLFMIEANGGGGYYAEIVRTFCIGHQPSQELKRAWEIAVEVQDFTVDMIRPGADCAEILAKVNEKLTSFGLPPETRLFAHGQGYDLVERPAFFKGEKMKVKENMFFAVHPEIVMEKALGNACDQFLVTKDGAVRVQTTPREIFVV